jgi:hypothetical protein
MEDQGMEDDSDAPDHQQTDCGDNDYLALLPDYVDEEDGGSDGEDENDNGQALAQGGPLAAILQRDDAGMEVVEDEDNTYKETQQRCGHKGRSRLFNRGTK